MLNLAKEIKKRQFPALTFHKYGSTKMMDPVEIRLLVTPAVIVQIDQRRNSHCCRE
jgi:hypothetical protein